MNANEIASAAENAMPLRPGAVCVGSVHWDWIGVTKCDFSEDSPGQIDCKPGGVALNVAAALNFLGIDAAIIGAVGGDREGGELAAFLNRIGLNTEFLLTIPGSRTDRYLAIENPNGLIAAIADTRTLEQAGSRILEILQNCKSRRSLLAMAGIIVVDGNLPLNVLRELHAIQESTGSKIAIVCASPGKAARISNLAGLPKSTIYMNLREANRLLGKHLIDAREAAKTLCEFGFNRVAVTNGPDTAAVASRREIFICRPPNIDAVRATGSGDVFVAAHIASELSGDDAGFALNRAVALASSFVAGDLEY